MRICLSSLAGNAASFAGPRPHKRVGVWRAAGICAPHPDQVGYDGSCSGDIAYCGIPAQASGGARVRAAGPDGARERLDSSDQTDRRPWQIGSLKRWAGSDEQNHTHKVQRLTLARCRGLVSLCLSSGPHQQAGSREVQRKQGLNRLREAPEREPGRK